MFDKTTLETNADKVTTLLGVHGGRNWYLSGDDSVFSGAFEFYGAEIVGGAGSLSPGQNLQALASDGTHDLATLPEERQSRLAFTVVASRADTNKFIFNIYS